MSFLDSLVSHVFSFGAVLVCLIERKLILEKRPFNKARNRLDPRYPLHKLALHCLREKSAQRPPATEIARQLNRIISV